MANEAEAEAAADLLPMDGSDAVQNEWMDGHQALVEIGCWIDREGHGIVRLKLAMAAPRELQAIALGMIHRRLDETIRQLLVAPAVPEC